MRYGLQRTNDWGFPSRFGFASDLDRWLDEFYPGSRNERWSSALNPACEVDETPSHYLVTLDAPGLKKEDFDIEVTGRRLIVSGERKRETKQAEGRPYSERSYGEFRREFEFPMDVVVSKVEAAYEHGVLHIALPKAESSTTRKVDVKIGEKTGFFDRLMGNKSEAA